MSEDRRREWFDDDGFWETLYPYMFGEARFLAAEEQCESLLALAKPAGTRALDLCCGPGRFAVALARRGFTVTGVDRTSFLLGEAQAQARQNGVEIEFVQCDMRDFVRPNAFDLAINLYTSFGYFDDKNEDVGVLKNIYASLAPGGRFVIDVMGKERLARVFQPTASTQYEDGAILVQRHEIFDDWTRVRNEWILIRDGKAMSFKFHHTLYSAAELRALLVQVGFHDVAIYGDMEGSPYGLDPWRLIAVAAK